MSEPASSPARAVTIREVAERAGVSKSLVSLVLRGDAHVSAARRSAVLEAMNALGYKPNRIAQSLSRARTDTVGVLLNDLRNPWFVELLEGLSATLHAAGLAPLIADSYTDQRVGRPSVETLVAHGVDGLIVVGTTAESAAIATAAATIPVVLAGTREPHLPHVDIAVDDDRAGARLATDHLISLGHQRIAHLRGPGEVGTLRHAGYQDAMSAAGLDQARCSETGGMSEESGYAAGRRLLRRRDRPSAIFAYNDIAAVGVLSAAVDSGVDVPEQLSVVGYDNTYLAKIRHLSLTSVDNGNFAVGIQAGKFLIERMKAPTLPARLHAIATELHVRGSTRPVPGSDRSSEKQ